MSNEYIKEIIASHKSKGMIEQNTGVTIIDNNLVKYNRYTLKISKIKASDFDVNYYNAHLIKEVKKDSNFYKEIREFNQLFKFFEKLDIKKGYIKKTETPDFEFSKDGNYYGIEITRIYTSNDWVAEKVHTDVIAYKLSGQRFKDYLKQKKFENRVKASTQSDGKLSIEAVRNEVFSDEEVTQIKNKIFEKIRKQFDDYHIYEYNCIFAEIVYSGYKEFSSYDEKLIILLNI